MKGKNWMAMALTLGLLVCFSGCGSKETPVYVQKVSSLSGISSSDRFSGMVVSENVTEIKKDQDKSVTELSVREGQDVKEGDPLFTYDTEQLQLTLDKQELELEQLNANIESFELQIMELQREREKVSANKKLQYTIQIQTAEVSQKEAELNLKTKEAEVEKSRALLENATVTSPVQGRVQAINETGTDSNGNPLPYITIQQSGAYRVKGVIGELQQGSINQGDRLKLVSRTDPNAFWLGTVSLVDYENPVKNNSDNYGMMSDEMTASSRYPFYVELDSMEGLIMGQHLYLERYFEDGDAQGVAVSGGFICYEEDGSTYIWAENGRGKLEKRPVVLGQYNEMTDIYYITDGVSEDDYIAYPDPELCRSGVPTTRTMDTGEAAEGEVS